MKKFNLAATMVAVAFISTSVLSYSYSAFSLMTGDNTLAINPYIFADGSGGVGTELFLAYGISDKADIWLSYYSDNTSENDFSIMARYDIKNANIIALKTSPSSASLQYHMIKENNKFAFQANAVVSFNYANMTKPDITTVLAPVVKIGSTGFDLFCEVNPAFYAVEDFGLDIVPGIGITIADVLVTFAAPIYDVTKNATPTFGAWAFFALTSK